MCIGLFFAVQRDEAGISSIPAPFCSGHRTTCRGHLLLYKLGFHRATSEDKIAFYADDTLVFLGDTGSSLSAVMSLIDLYRSFSGFNINWEKSVVILVDPGYVEHTCQIHQLALVTFKYLEVVITLSFTAYTDRNILPLIAKFRQQRKTWSKISLSMVGRVNLVKMVWMPQMLYVLHNCPIWLTLRLLIRFLGILCGRGGEPRIRLETLKQPIDKGGIAIPNVRLYFIASQLEHWHGWEVVNMEHYTEDNSILI